MKSLNAFTCCYIIFSLNSRRKQKLPFVLTWLGANTRLRLNELGSTTTAHRSLTTRDSVEESGPVQVTGTSFLSALSRSYQASELRLGSLQNRRFLLLLRFSGERGQAHSALAPARLKNACSAGLCLSC